MRYLRLFALFLFLCGLGLWVLLSQRFYLAEYILTDRLEEIGGKNIELVIDTIRFDSVIVSSLSASFSDDFVFHALALQNLVLHFQPFEIIKGVSTKLTIDKLTLKLNKKNHQHKQDAPLPFQKIRSYIPQAVSIKELILSTPELNGDMQLQISAKNLIQQPLTLHAAFSSEELVLKDLAIKGLSGEIFLHTKDGENISIDENSHLKIDGLQAGSTHLEKTHLQFSAHLNKKSENNSWQIPAAKIELNTLGLTHQEMIFHSAPITLEAQVQSKPLQAHVTVKSDDFFLQRKDKSLKLKSIQATLTSDNVKHELNIQLSHGEIPGRLTSKISHNLKYGRGQASFSTLLPFDLHSKQTGLGQLIQGLDLPLDIYEGLVNCEGKLKWDKNQLQKIQAAFNLRNGAGTYGNTTFNGLIIQQDLELFPEIRTRSPGYVSISEIQNGLTSRNLSLQNQLLVSDSSLWPILLVNSIQTELFGGIVSSKNIHFDLQKRELDCEIQLNRIDLAEVIKLNKMKGLRASGILDGNIHAQWKNNQLIIPNGELHSRAPGGTINYLPPGGSEGLSTLPAYALKALEEFNYNTLTATPSYKEDGTLIINIHIEGHSPPLKTSRPVHLNLNTEQNLLSLLQSLRYSKNLTDELEQRLQNRPLKN